MSNAAQGVTLSPTASPLTSLVRASLGRVCALALLDFAWFMALPLLVGSLVDAAALALVPIALGTVVEVVRLFARQKVRRGLRSAFMARAARQALWKDAAIPEVRSDAAFWGAHIAEYAVSLDAPAIVGAGLATLLTLAVAGYRIGPGAVLQVGAVLLVGVVLGVLSNRLRRRGVDATVDERQHTATWMAAAVRDNGELASPRATARFLDKVSEVTLRWCEAEETVERARTRHRLAIATLCGLALYAVALLHGIDLLRGLPKHETLSDSLIGALLLGSCLPAAYAFAAHLESIAVANSELSRLALGSSERRAGAEIRLQTRPLSLQVSAATVRHDQALSLDLAELQVTLNHPVGIAGPNGSGKTTLASLIAGVRSPTTGSVMLDGVPASDLSRDDVAFVPQDPVLVETLSILENLRLVAADCESDQALAVLASLGLDRGLDRPAGNLSRGEQRRIAIARALLKSPKLLILDEPDAWLDVAGRRSLLQTLLAISQETSILVVSHRPDVLLQFQTVVVLDDHHRVEAVAHPSQLRLDSPAFRALLGAQLDEPALDAAPHH